MPKRKGESEIGGEDCPANPATAYPGLYGRNNRNGSVLTKQKFKEEAVRRWVEHFGDSEKYENTSLAHKARYLIRHLKAFKVNTKEARALLVKVESDETKGDTEEEENPVEGEGVEDDDGTLAAVNDDQMEEDEDVSNDQQDELGGGDGDGEGYHSEEEDMQCDGEDDQDMELVENLEDDSSEESRVAVEFEVRKFMEKSDEELFKSELEVPSCVEQSAKFKERKRKFIKTYMEEQDFQNSQEILEAFSQAPPVVEDCLKQRLSHLTKQEKATRLIVKTLSDTIQRLKETPGAESRKQVQVILAAATHHRFN